MSRVRIHITKIRWKGRTMTPVRYESDALITLLPPKYASKLRRAGTVGILTEEEWGRIQSIEGSGYNLDPAYT